MRDAEGFAPQESPKDLFLKDQSSMRRPNIGPVLLMAAMLAAAGAYLVPRGLEAKIGEKLAWLRSLDDEARSGGEGE